jgi:hypothetical protein
MVAVFALPAVSLATPKATHSVAYSYSGPHLNVKAMAEWGDGGFVARFAGSGEGPLGGSASAAGYLYVAPGQPVEPGFRLYVDPPTCTRR